MSLVRKLALAGFMGWATMVWWAIVAALLATLALTSPTWGPVVLAVLLARSILPER